MSPLQKIRSEIEKIAKNPKAQLLAVSKLQTQIKIRSAFSEGQIYFGENYVQESLQKQEELKDLNIHWHFIGHLQKNKVKQIVGKFDLIHSVDSLELAQKISTEAAKLNITQKILLQVNLAGEESKGGFSNIQITQVIHQIQSLPNLELSGLMTMPPLTENPEDVRPYFKQLKVLGDKFHLTELSMGTSSDYKVALEEGATWVRLGTVVFGERPKKVR